MKKKRIKRAVIILSVVVLFIWLNNTSLLVKKENRSPLLLAHRGLAQTFDQEGVKGDTNTARIIHEPEHPYLENTLSSIKAAFDYGADIVEFDLRITKDKKLAVFHDDRLEYRTDGTGKLVEYTLAELQRLDVGYGYTADNGKTFPFRGKGKGLMPSPGEIFKACPDKELLVHIKDGGREAGVILCGYLAEMKSQQRGKISVYGNEAAILYIRREYPQLKVLTKSLLIKAFIHYALLGWSGYVPPAIRNLEIHMPLNYARLLWGWPHRFLQRMESVNSRFVLVNGNGGFSSGFNTQKELEKIPALYSGCLWTDRINIIAPFYP